jgi:nicotinamide-nucleotide amidase
VSGARAHLLMIGDELLAGDVVDRNKAFLGQRCRTLGIEVVRASTVRDREDEIVAAMREAAGQCDICLVSGGLGPTTDDLTAAAAALAAGVELVRHPELAARIEAFFAARNRALIEANLKQADLPAGATMLDNPIGTAAGFAVELTVEAGSCWLFSMPGVPRELHMMMREQVEPRVRERFELQPVPRRVYRSLGRGESAVQHAITDILAAARTRSPGLANMYVHYRARYPEVQVILEATRGPDGAAATRSELEQLDAPLREALAPAVYAIGPDDGPAELPELLVAALIERGLTIATAESCTGGGVGEALTEIAGSSACFVGGVIAYSNQVKMEVLGVPPEVLEANGAVSEPVARAMAEGVRARLRTDIGISTTGIAGPGGGTPDKPVGTVDVAVATASGTIYQRLRLFGPRDVVRQATVAWVLKLVWDQLS